MFSVYSYLYYVYCMATYLAQAVYTYIPKLYKVIGSYYK